MVMTGYIFLDISDIKPYLEICGKGETFDFLSQLAKRLNSYVFCGYPELFINQNGEESYFNSAYLISR